MKKKERKLIKKKKYSKLLLHGNCNKMKNIFFSVINYYKWWYTNKAQYEMQKYEMQRADI